MKHEKFKELNVTRFYSPATKANRVRFSAGPHGSSLVGYIVDVAIGRRLFSWYSRFPRLRISLLLHPRLILSLPRFNAYTVKKIPGHVEAFGPALLWFRYCKLHWRAKIEDEADKDISAELTGMKEGNSKRESAFRPVYNRKCAHTSHDVLSAPLGDIKLAVNSQALKWKLCIVHIGKRSDGRSLYSSTGGERYAADNGRRRKTLATRCSAPDDVFAEARRMLNDCLFTRRPVWCASQTPILIEMTGGVLVWGGIMLGCRLGFHVLNHCYNASYAAFFLRAVGPEFFFMNDYRTHHRTAAVPKLHESVRRRVAHSRETSSAVDNDPAAEICTTRGKGRGQLVDNFPLSMEQTVHTRHRSQRRSNPLLRTAFSLPAVTPAVLNFYIPVYILVGGIVEVVPAKCAIKLLLRRRSRRATHSQGMAAMASGESASASNRSHWTRLYHYTVGVHLQLPSRRGIDHRLLGLHLITPHHETREPGRRDHRQDATPRVSGKCCTLLFREERPVKISFELPIMVAMSSSVDENISNVVENGVNFLRLIRTKLAQGATSSNGTNPLPSENSPLSVNLHPCQLVLGSVFSLQCILAQLIRVSHQLGVRRQQHRRREHVAECSPFIFQMLEAFCKLNFAMEQLMMEMFHMATFAQCWEEAMIPYYPVFVIRRCALRAHDRKDHRAPAQFMASHCESRFSLDLDGHMYLYRAQFSQDTWPEVNFRSTPGKHSPFENKSTQSTIEKCRSNNGNYSEVHNPPSKSVEPTMETIQKYTHPPSKKCRTNNGNYSEVHNHHRKSVEPTMETIQKYTPHHRKSVEPTMETIQKYTPPPSKSVEPTMETIQKYTTHHRKVSIHPTIEKCRTNSGNYSEVHNPPSKSVEPTMETIQKYAPHHRKSVEPTMETIQKYAPHHRKSVEPTMETIQKYTTHHRKSVEPTMETIQKYAPHHRKSVEPTMETIQKYAPHHRKSVEPTMETIQKYTPHHRKSVEPTMETIQKYTPHHRKSVEPTMETIQKYTPHHRKSPDLNTIEHIWDELDRRVRARQARPKSIARLTEWLQEEWRRIPADVLQTLVESMPDRVAAVIAARVGRTTSPVTHSYSYCGRLPGILFGAVPDTVNILNTFVWVSKIQRPAMEAHCLVDSGFVYSPPESSTVGCRRRELPVRLRAHLPAATPGCVSSVNLVERPEYLLLAGVMAGSAKQLLLPTWDREQMKENVLHRHQVAEHLLTWIDARTDSCQSGVPSRRAEFDCQRHVTPCTGKPRTAAVREEHSPAPARPVFGSEEYSVDLRLKLLEEEYNYNRSSYFKVYLYSAIRQSGMLILYTRVWARAFRYSVYLPGETSCVCGGDGYHTVE
ncbi:hypothetical protein PR048_031790 [Dryococelus australis]|uniref:Uncharacterized protein n=1 Tax=Dryococelus australis TaxID=614101 RepID=A0ABQ9G6A9_9NEOP|nr:hypothetical protein PR048_031790 [Dryococelus australis]